MSKDSELIARKVDQVQLFMLYAMFGGDTKRVSVVSGCEVQAIEALAENHGWKLKINGRQRLDTDEGKEIERQLNRVGIYVTADRLQRVFTTLINELDSDPSYARAFCTQIDPDTNEASFNTKNLVELAKGFEIVSNIKYRALGDKVAENADTTGNKQSTTNIVLNLYKSMADRFDHIPAVDTASRVAQAAIESAVPAKDAGEAASNP